jgi:NADP-dependent 3-hydroxy acid dehydrogenase YdfG
MYTPFDLSGKVALVTGGNSGIGLGMARAMAAAGADIAIWGTNPEKNAAAKAELESTGRRVLALACEVGNEAAVEAAMAETLSVLGRVDGCFANAGVSGRGSSSFLALSAEEWHRVLAVNLDGAFYTLRAAARHMVQRGGGGALVGTASLAAIEGAARNEHYAATKGGLISMLRALAGGVCPARHSRQRDSTRLDRDQHDGGRHRQRKVRRQCAAAHSHAALGDRRRFRRYRRLLNERGLALPHGRHLPDRRRLRFILNGGYALY